MKGEASASAPEFTDVSAGLEILSDDRIAIGLYPKGADRMVAEGRAADRFEKTKNTDTLSSFNQRGKKAGRTVDMRCFDSQPLRRLGVKTQDLV